MGETLKRMSLKKAVPEGLKSVECERGVGGKNSPIRYIPEQDPIQDALETKNQPTPLKFTLPNGSEMRKMRWASGTPEHFLIHVKGAIHAIKEMELYIKFKEATAAVETAHLDLDIAKATLKEKKGDNDDTPQQTGNAVKVMTDKGKKSKKPEGEEALPAAIAVAKADVDKARKARNEVQARADVLGAQIFQLYGNLLTDEARQPWKKIVKEQTDTFPWEDLRGEVHEKKAGKTWTSFLECVMFHLRSVFKPDAADAVKFYITNTLKKPNRVPIWQFFMWVEQLNSYLKTLPCQYHRRKVNLATKPVTLLEDANLATHLLQMYPVEWQRMYDLMNNSTPVSTRDLLLVPESIKSNVKLNEKPPSKDKANGADPKCKMDSIDACFPKKAKRGWAERHSFLCKKHGCAHTMYNTKECRCYNSDGTCKKLVNNPTSDRPSHEKDKWNFAQLNCTETRQAVRAAFKMANHGNRRRRHQQDSDSVSDSDY